MGRINMESKEYVIQQIMERCKSRFDNIIGKALDGIEQDFRNAYNEGYRCCEKEKASEYQRGYAEAESHYKDIIEMREKTAFENGYKKCLEENDFYDGSIFDMYYKVGDEVIADNGTACFVITSLDGNDIGGIDGDGNTYAYMPDQICYKTGRHFNVCGLLNDIRIERKDGD